MLLPVHTPLIQRICMRYRIALPQTGLILVLVVFLCAIVVGDDKG